MLTVRVAPWLLVLSCGLFPLQTHARPSSPPEPPGAHALLARAAPSLLGDAAGQRAPGRPIRLMEHPTSLEDPTRIVGLIALAELLPAALVQEESPPPLVPAPETGKGTVTDPGTTAGPTAEPGRPPPSEQGKATAPDKGKATAEQGKASAAVDDEASRQAREDYVAARVGVSTLASLLGGVIGGAGGGLVAIPIGIGAFNAIGIGGGPFIGLLIGTLALVGIVVAGIVVGAVVGVLVAVLVTNLLYPPMPEPTVVAPTAPDTPEGSNSGEAPPRPTAAAPVRPRRELPKNTLNTAPFNYLISRISIEYERVLSENFSVFGAPIVQLSSWSNLTGGGFNAGARWFPGGRAPTGLFIQPQVHLDRGRYDYNLTNEDGTLPLLTYAGAGAAVGFSAVMGEAFYWSIGLGGAVQYTWQTRQISGIPLVRGNLGVAF